MTTLSALSVLTNDEAAEVLGYLSRDLVESVFLRGLIHRTGLDLGRRSGCFVAHRTASGELGGVMLMSSLVVPFITAPEGAAAFAKILSSSPYAMRNIVGRRQAVADLWEAMAPWRPEPRLIRSSQPVYLVGRRELLRLPAPGLRAAVLSDLETLVGAGAKMMIEEVDEDPLRNRPDQYRSFVRDRIRRRDEFLWVDGKGLRFKCNVSSRTPEVALIEGVYTPPERRRRGFATRGLSQVCQTLLEDIPQLCLYVNDFNLAAIKLYENLGFKRISEYQSIFFD